MRPRKANGIDGVLKRIESEGIRGIDLQFVDLLGGPPPRHTGDHRRAGIVGDIEGGGSHDRFTRDSRYIAQKAAQFAADQGYDTTYWGPEIEFFVFDGIRLTPTPDHARNPSSGAGYEILSREAPWHDNGGKNVKDEE